MSVIVMSASARQRLLSRTESSQPRLANADEDAARRQALTVRRSIATAEFPLTSSAHAMLLAVLR
ncbi:hypothetical protein S58_33680 [Bradyrhizobium oligotrophicum S58]|uniref:Uncharacterized protein n=1 Tax=Bradyrhizobium oligotrophicum S58 TaxID=1245469 RepID=M4Z788_9BRAD|nr:hypothetical protein [Bradyrhizobium oligotrophicum]BAM89364.1 hypothetical protein S58_33680 [Bradyrhizobium oligotrophicum S58]